MKKKIRYLLLLFLCPVLLQAKSAITYGTPRGRTGDQLIKYCKAKWISYKYNLPLLYKPFSASSRLLLHEIEQHYNTNDDKKFDHIVFLQPGNESDITDLESTLYVINVHFKCKEWKRITRPQIKDKLFLNELRKLIQVKKTLPHPMTPKNMISVAVHVRKGGGYDPILFSKSTQYSDKRWPLKFPPDSYYLEQIKKIAQKYKRSNIYIYIFTDDPSPIVIMKKYQKILNNPRLHFNCRKKQNSHKLNVLEDLFAMTHFDCLIRPSSSFSTMSQLLGDFNLIIHPMHHVWHGNTLIIDRVEIIKQKKVQ